MLSISSLMTADHRACDAPFVEFENSVGDGDWGSAGCALEALRMATQRHFQMEEEVLFPAFEAATGMTGGPTQVMRGEHDQMRALLEQLAEGVSAQDATRVLGLTESFMVFIQQHNMKEEQILYPMTDQRLADAAEVMEKLRAFLA